VSVELQYFSDDDAGELIRHGFYRVSFKPRARELIA
jgi:hypothetical protein